ncbi:sensor histidine kinase [Luedemannella helvata]|uniref:histidine kinase n=1 Tax=Luedemannella helvata TaxID=349315 RepID=A0ABP4VT64_9ACTN
MPVRLRRLVDRVGLSWTDVLLAAVFVAAAVIAAAVADPADAQGPLRMRVEGEVPDAAAVPVAPPAPDTFGGADGPAAPDVPEMPEKVNPLAGVIAGAALAVRRRLPYTAFLVAVGGIIVIRQGLLWPGFVAIIICAYSVVTYGRSVAVGLGLLAVTAGGAAARFDESIPSLPGWLGPFVVLLLTGLAAAALRNARARADAAARRADALEKEQAAAARAAIAEERARIARELHDVVSHHVSVMVVQAGAAGKVIGTRPDLARGALGAIESSGREAMAELRQLLGLMAPADDQLRPQPGLADLDTLVDAVRAAGQPVTLRRDDVEVPPTVDLTAYRVVQEGLTNALRYAPGAATDVDIRLDDEVLVVEVRNTAAAPADPAVPGAGRGLLGLGERIRLHDGTLETHRTLSGGFHLTARIPT